MMLQQTQVLRVIPKYEAFLKEFPTAKSLAHAQLIDVLKNWSGLGYNRRAKYLHDAAKNIVSRHGRDFPKHDDELRALPGIGDYTAKAIRVFAYDEPEVLIETNIRTVFLHHFFPRSKKVEDATLIPLIASTLKGQDPRTFYSALMDYGSHLKLLHPNPSRRSKHYVRQSKFEGSVRQVRGEILRALARETSLKEIARKFGEKYIYAFQSLVRDGLIHSQ